MSKKKIKSALISVYHKEGLEEIVKELARQEVRFYSTGGTQVFLEGLGISVTAVEDLTDYPSIFGGRVKTLHPKVFGGILHRRGHDGDLKEASNYSIPEIDLVIVDLYPFEETVAAGCSEPEIIEKIDIGGISLIRAAAKNYQDVLIVPGQAQYKPFLALLKEKQGETTLADRQLFASHAFNISSHYDTAIFTYFNQQAQIPALKASYLEGTTLRYGENPHQQGKFYGAFDQLFEQLHGKALSYNNLVDIEGAVGLVEEFSKDIAFGIIKHTNACGMATGKTVAEAYQKAFAADTVSAFGGILATNRTVDLAAAQAMQELFFEVLIAPDFDTNALELLQKKKNRILLKQKMPIPGQTQFRTLLNGVLYQDKDLKTDQKEDLKYVTDRKPSEKDISALLFASKIAKHTKSNTIVLAIDGQLLASGVGQTSRVDALNQAVDKARRFGFDLSGACMASDAFFPFPDCVEIAAGEGIASVIQPGGSIRDQDSIDACNKHGMSMVFTGIRHFKH